MPDNPLPPLPTPTRRRASAHRPGAPHARLAAALALLLGLALASADAWAQKRLALVIGNGDYSHESKLANPASDARLIARTLRGLGFAVDERLNLPRSEMSRAITRFVRESAGADTAVLYYAGHGMQPINGGRNFLLPVDANIVDDDALNADAIAADTIVDQLERQANPARLRLVVLDACRTNRQAGRARSGVRGLARMTPSDDYTLIAFSTNDQDVALDGSGANSPYAQALSRHLARAGELPLRRVFELTATDVRAATGQKQRPRTYGDLDSRVGLDGQVLATVVPEPRPAPAPVSDPAQVDQQAWAAAQRANTAAAYTAYLAEYPSGRFASVARVALAALQPAPAPVPQQTAPRAGEVITDCAGCPSLVVLPRGEFDMGSPEGEAGRDGDEGPVRRVRIAYGLAVGRQEVTRAEFGRFVAATGYKTEAERNVGQQGCFAWNGSKYDWTAERSWRDPGFEQGEDHPVVCVSWNDAQAYLKWLNEVAPGKSFRLLSEAEWEYAARAGQGSRRYPWVDDSDNRGQCTWANGADETAKARVPGASGWTIAPCSDGHAYTAPGLSLKPNAYGLHHMHGNVWEWVQDVWHADYKGAPTDGRAWTEGGDQARRVLRGGSWFNDPGDLRAAVRNHSSPGSRNYFTGFRIARTF